MPLKSSVNHLKVLVAIIFIFGGFSIAFTSHPILKINPSMRFVGLGLMFLGIFYLYYIFKSTSELKERKEEEERKRLMKEERFRRRGVRGHSQRTAFGGPYQSEVEEETVQSIVSRIMSTIAKSAENISFYTLPIIGALIIDAVIIFNIITGQGLNFETWDTITIMLGAALIAYNFIPENYGITRDFLVFFLAILFIILIFPQLFYSYFVGNEASARYTQILLADPVVGLLNLFGIESRTAVEVMDGGSYTAMIHYTMADGTETQVGITEACSGIYTTSIFISAFITFIFIEYKKINLKVITILILGILTSYIANIFRMTIITGIGHYYGTEALLEAHANAGWLIFLAWIIPFWYLVFKYLIKDSVEEQEAVPT